MQPWRGLGEAQHALCNKHTTWWCELYICNTHYLLNFAPDLCQQHGCPSLHGEGNAPAGASPLATTQAAQPLVAQLDGAIVCVYIYVCVMSVVSDACFECVLVKFVLCDRCFVCAFVYHSFFICSIYIYRCTRIYIFV